MKRPNKDKKHVKRFIGHNFPHLKAAYIPHTPLNGKPENECIDTVEEYIISNGGALILGWAIWEEPNVLIEAEFHAIWQSPEGDFFDISPRPSLSNLKRILFLQDTSINYKGKQIDNIREPISKDPRVKKYIQLSEEYFLETNKGDLAFKYGEIEASPEILKIKDEMNEIEISILTTPLTR